MATTPQPPGNTPWIQAGGTPSPIFLQYMTSLDATVGATQAWTPYTPIISANSGAFTTVSASGRYLKIGKTIFVRLRVTITTNGTAAGFVIASLPFTSEGSFNQNISGRENGLTGKMLVGSIVSSTSNVLILNYDATYPGANGALLDMTGIYESA